MPVHVVDHPLVKHKLALMREHDITTKDFRDLASELANLLTYEATKHLETEPVTIQGWAGEVEVEKIKGKRAISCIYYEKERYKNNSKLGI